MLTGRLAARAAGRAEIHDCLRVISNALLRRVVLGVGPQRIADCALTGPAVYRVVTRQDSLHVAIKNWRPGIHGQREDRAGGRAANAGERLEAGKVMGEYPVVQSANLLGTAV